MIEAIIFLFFFITILIIISIVALISIIEECDNELTRRDKKLYKKNEEIKKDLWKEITIAWKDLTVIIVFKAN